MAQVKYDIFTYQLSPITTNQQDLFREIKSADEIMANKNGRFYEVFHDDISFFHRRFKLTYQVEYHTKDVIIIRLANKKKVAIEKGFHRAVFDSEPSSVIIIYNNEDYQYMVIESDRTSFGTSFTVMRILYNALSRELAKYNLQIKIHPKYEEKAFWDLVDQYSEQIEALKFEYEYPNLARVNQTLIEDLKLASKELSSSKTKLEFDATKTHVLTNLTEDNKQLTNMVKASASGAGPIKIKLKTHRNWESTENKVSSLHFDELTVDLPGDSKQEFVEAIIDKLKNQ